MVALGQAWYVGDALGSVRQTLDGSGAVLAATGYSPWGVPQQPLTTPFGFTGELQQQDRVHLRARWYDPGTGTLTSRDPWEGWPERPDSLHPYVYAGNNPVLHTDPSGETWYLSDEAADEAAFTLFTEARQLGSNATLFAVTSGMFAGGSAAMPYVLGEAALSTAAAPITIIQISGIGAGVFGVWNACEGYYADRLAAIAELIWTTRRAAKSSSNTPALGVALMHIDKTLYALNRTTGSLYALQLEWFVTRQLPASLQPHVTMSSTSDVHNGYFFGQDPSRLEVFPPRARSQSPNQLTPV